MRKIMISLMAVLLTAPVFAGSFLDVEGTDKNRLIYEMRDNQHLLATGNATLTNNLAITGALTVTGAITGSNLTTTTSAVTGGWRVTSNLVVGGTSSFTGTVATTADLTQTALTNAVLTVIGAEGSYSEIAIPSDQEDDVQDDWAVRNTDGELGIQNNETNRITVTAAGAVSLFSTLTVGTDLTVSGGDIAGMNTTAIDMGEATAGTVAVTATNTTISGRATVTGILTMTGVPAFGTTNAPGAGAAISITNYCPATVVSPVWVNCTISGDTNAYVFAVFAK